MPIVFLRGFLILIALLLPALNASAIEKCEMYSQAVDFRSSEPVDRKHIALVVSAHFTSSVRAGISGNTSTDIMADLDYTLRHIPNHPQALLVTMRHQKSSNYRPGRPERYGHKWPGTECYLKRAQQIAPDDAAVYTIEGIYHHGEENYALAEGSYKRALELAKSRQHVTEICYNLGLLYVDMDDYENAKLYAEKAYSMQYPLLGLKKKLQKMAADKDK